MKRLFTITLAGAALVLSAFALPTQTVTIDVDDPGVVPALTFMQATAPRLAVRLEQAGKPYRNLSGYTGRFYYGSSLTSEAFVVVTSTNVDTAAGAIIFDLTDAETNTNGTFGAYFLVTAPTNRLFWYGEGTLDIRKTTITTGAGALVLTSVTEQDPIWAAQSNRVQGLEAHLGARSNDWNSVTGKTTYADVAASNAVAIGSANLSSERNGWRVWSDGTNNFAVHGSGSGAITNASFAWLMAHVLTNSGSGAVINFGNEHNEGGGAGALLVDGPIGIGKGITFRGQGNYGTLVRPATGYAGPMWICGTNDVGVGGIIAFDRIRFEDVEHINTNAVIDYSRCAESKVYDCEFTGNVGPAIRMDVSRTAGYSHWNSISRVWFVGLNNVAPMIDLVATNGNAIHDMMISDCHFWTTTNTMISAQGLVSALQVHGSRFKYFGPAAGTATGVLVRGGNGVVVNDNAFYGWTINTTPISFVAATSNDFRATIIGNSFATNCATTNAISIGANAHGVMVVGNSVAPVIYSTNVGGFNGLGTAAGASSNDWRGASWQMRWPLATVASSGLHPTQVIPTHIPRHATNLVAIGPWTMIYTTNATLTHMAWTGAVVVIRTMLWEGTGAATGGTSTNLLLGAVGGSVTYTDYGSGRVRVSGAGRTALSIPLGNAVGSSFPIMDALLYNTDLGPATNFGGVVYFEFAP